MTGAGMRGAGLTGAGTTGADATGRKDGGARKRVIVYYPSFAHWGGAEKQALLTAAALTADYDVELCTEHLPAPSAISGYFGVDLAGVQINPLRPGGPLVTRLLGSRQRMQRWQHALLRWSHGRQLGERSADLLVSVEPSPPIAPRHAPSIYSCFFPFGEEIESFDTRWPVRAYHLACRVLERALLEDPVAARDRWTTVIANSHYTAEWIERLWHRQAEVVHPPCDDMGPPAAKEPWILSVGRFQQATTTLPTKSFDVLIDAFRVLCERSDQPYELHLAGHCGNDPASRAFLQELEQLAVGLPVVFHSTIDHDSLRDLYRRSALFWLATGFGFDPERHPGKQEHFGIVTVEAMSAGAVPILRAAGGSIEIIAGQEIGGLWNTPDDLVATSLALLADAEELTAQSARCVQRARQFSSAEFTRRTREIVSRVLTDVSCRAAPPS
jgi:glycosyltransferase involved in cell wall biosynthesis